MQLDIIQLGRNSFHKKWKLEMVMTIRKLNPLSEIIGQPLHSNLDMWWQMKLVKSMSQILKRVGDMLAGNRPILRIDYWLFRKLI